MMDDNSSGGSGSGSSSNAGGEDLLQQLSNDLGLPDFMDHDLNDNPEAGQRLDQFLFGSGDGSVLDLPGASDTASLFPDMMLQDDGESEFLLVFCFPV